MTDNKITPAWVVENYLPDYDARWRIYLKEALDSVVDKTGIDLIAGIEFESLHFREALDAFAKSICERQREILRKDAIDSFNIFLSKTNMYRTEQMEALNDFCRTYDNSVRCAPMPDLTKNR